MGLSKSLMGECKNGVIYKGVGLSSAPIGELRNGAVYSGIDFIQRNMIGSADSIEGAAVLFLQ